MLGSDVMRGYNDTLILCLLMQGDSDDVQDTARFAGVTFPVAAMIYLCMGVLGNLWDPGWLIVPVCGVLAGVVGTVEYFQPTK